LRRLSFGNYGIKQRLKGHKDWFTTRLQEFGCNSVVI
jgi:hypothetical protein